MNPIRLVPSLLSLLFACGVTSASAETPNQPISTGKVQWGRDLDKALALSKDSGKPVFLLFQEIPGCSGCQDFGREVLSVPGVVSAIEQNFVPLLVANNQGGRDAEILKRFHEPAWNYQVIRFLNAEGQDLIPRKDLVWTQLALIVRMVQALEAAKRPVPTTLKSLTSNSTEKPKTERAAFAQHCFWTGEMKLGQIEGVVKTEAGFFAGNEVTLVDYNPAQVSFTSLVKQASQAQCADAIYVTTSQQADLASKSGSSPVKTLSESYRKAPISDQKKQLQNTPFAGLTLDDEQATKINAFARVDSAKAAQYLSPEQREKLAARNR